MTNTKQDLTKLKNKKLFLFDIDGVIRVGDIILDGAKQLVEYINQTGGKSIFITNNSTKNCNSYVQYFRDFGFDVDESNFFTALSVTVKYLLSHHKQDKIFVLGTKSLVDELVANGLNITTMVEDHIDVVLVAYDNELTYQKLSDVCKVLQTQQTTYLATNIDNCCPIDFGFVPDCGSIVDMIYGSTKQKPKFLGKPNPDMVNAAIASTNFTQEQTIVVGDRLYTDIACGINAGVDTCTVFTGEVKPADLQNTEYMPTYQFDNIMQLYLAYKE